MDTLISKGCCPDPISCMRIRLEWRHQGAPAAPAAPAGPRGAPPAPGANAPAASNPCAPPPPAGAPPAAAATGPPPIPPVAARVPIDIGNSSAENVSFTLTPGYTLMGKVAMENPPVTADASGPRGMRVTLTHDPDLVGLPGAPQGAVQANGTFCLANVAQGDYRVYVPPLLNTFQWGTSTLPPAPSEYLHQIDSAWRRGCAVRRSSPELRSTGTARSRDRQRRESSVAR